MAGLASSAQSAILTEHIDIECLQPKPLTLLCDYRTLNNTKLVSSAAEYAGISVVGEEIFDQASESRSIAILFLIDTSDPGRGNVVGKNREHIQRMVETGNARHVYGLAAFDSELEVLCELGCTSAEIIAKKDLLQAKGKTTELYRNLLEAIRLLRRIETRARQIVLMSDGLAEDLAYYHEDVVAAARKDRVVISSVGYPRSAAQSVALQTLRRLSEETGGLFVQANHTDYDIPTTFFEQVISAFDGSGQITFDLELLQQQGIDGNIDVSLKLQATEQHYFVPVSVSIPPLAPIAEPIAGPPILTKPKEKSRGPVNPMAPANTLGRPNSTWFWYGLPAMVFSAFLVLALAYALGSRRRRDQQPLYPTTYPTPHAFLIAAGNDRVRHKIDQTPWRIGRVRSSNLRLDDTSVSRLHAEIRCDALGQFTLQDLESLNGVYVNSIPVEMIHLEENDRVEIGDVAFKFTLHDEDYSEQEPTVLVRTIAPK